MTDHQHVAPHIVKAFLHLENLHAPVEAVLLRPVLHELKFSCREFIVLLRGKIIFPGNQSVLIKGLVLLIFSLQTSNLCLKLELVLFEGELLLFHGNQCVAQNVLLLGKFGLGVENLKVEVVVAQSDDDIASLQP